MIKYYNINSFKKKKLFFCKKMINRQVFPFTAIIGQTNMKLALILNVIDPRIGGVMSMGDRGTGKSTFFF